MVIYLYRWRLKEGKEEVFAKAWAYVTQELRTKCGSLGSRLHKGNDGLYYGYAQWPSSETRDRAKLSNPQIDKSRSEMREATEESLPEIILHPTQDFLLPLSGSP